MSHTDTAAHDPSGRVRRGHLPALRAGRNSMSRWVHTVLPRSGERSMKEFPAPSHRPQLNFGFGNTAFVSANSAGAITWMSPLFACITPGRPPSFWPLTNLVGP